MDIEIKTALADAEMEEIARLWNAEYPENLKYESVAGFEKFLAGVAAHRHHLIRGADGRIAAWLVAFTRDAERWFSIIVDAAAQKKGLGRALVDEAKRRETALCGWVVAHDGYRKADGAAYRSPLDFYRRLGFAVFDDVRLEKGDFYAVKIRWQKEDFGF